MARYPQGATVTLSFTVKDATGTLVDASPISLAVRKPDGTATTGSPYTPTHDGVGLYHVDLPLTDITTIGHYQHALTATISGKAGVQVGSFDVFDPFEVSVLSLQDGKDVLNITSSSQDARIQRKIATIEANIEKMIGGPILTRQIVERVELTSGYTTLVLRQRPVVSVVSVVSVASGTPLSISDLEIDSNANIVRRKLGLPFYGPYFTWMPVFTVTYTAGLGTEVEPAIAEAAEVILAHLWETERGATQAPSFGGQETVTPPGWGFAIPNYAAELLAPYALEAYV